MSIFDQPFDRQRDAAVVTGAGNGIGRAIAQALTGEGVRTLFVDLGADKAGAAAKAAGLAPMALAVLSNRIGGYVSGASIVVDGGMALTNWFEPTELD